MVRMVLMTIERNIPKKLCANKSAYTISPTAAGTKKTAIFLVMTVAAALTESGFNSLKKRQKNSNIIPMTLPGTMPPVSELIKFPKNRNEKIQKSPLIM